MKRNMLFLFMVCIILSSCAADLYTDIATNTVIPQVTAPAVQSFEEEHGIVVNWNIDAGAEKYIVYRDTSPTGSFSQKVYEGTATSYTDTAIQDEYYYYYKLAKVRGKQEFAKSDYVMGLSSGIKKDKYEANELSGCSATLEDITLANIFYYKDELDNEVEDRDWYCISVPARRSMKIVIDNLKNGLNGSDIAEDEIRFNVEEGALQAVYNNVYFWLDNYSYEPQTMRFQISVNKKLIGNKIVNYRVHIAEVVSNQTL
jgi:uncharacterized protein YceK